VGISGSSSFASLFFVFGVLFELVSWAILRFPDVLEHSSPSGANLVRSAPLLIAVGVLSILMSVFCAILVILPIKLKSRVWTWLSCLPTVFFLYAFLRLFYLHMMDAKRGSLPVALAMSLASDIVLLAIVRKSLNWLLARTSVPRMAIVIGIQLLLFLVIVVLPYEAMAQYGIKRADSALGGLLFLLVVFNFPTAVASVSFIASLCFLLLHRYTWPLLSQLTYVLTRPEVLQKRAAVRWTASGLIAFGLAGIPASSFILELLQAASK
jgi:hypothetical protein